ncbi:helix-turn-helix transcriptional regulator [Streptomyces huasconensis]|uniref:helix-turn-helix transcriptional regulator n=1 Tax=Streptomyces huasconensis TaxID=1854574 RepID=UPI003702E33E
MVDRPDLIASEIAEQYGVSIHTVTKSWVRHPEWPASHKRGRYKAYDAQAVADFVRDHVARPPVELEPRSLYTAREIADATGISEGTIRADRSRGRWPEPDFEGSSDGVNRWYGKDVAEALAGRRGYRRHTNPA